MAAPSPNAKPAAAKLPAIPQSNPGEPPYFLHVYKQRSEAARVVTTEAASLGGQVAWAGATLFRINKYRTHYFRWSERLASAREALRISNMATQAPWDTINDIVRDFEAATVAHAETCVSHVHRFLKGRTPLPKSVIPLDDDDHSFVIRDAGVLIHVWRSQAEAKTYINGSKMLTSAVANLRCEGVAVPLTALMVVGGAYVSATALAPLASEEQPEVGEGPNIAHCIDELEVICRTQTPLKLWQGADGRLHALDPTPCVHKHEPVLGDPDKPSMAGGDFYLGAHHGLFHAHPNVAVTVPRALEEAAAANVGLVAHELTDTVLQRAGGNAANVRGVVKVLELVEEGLAPSIFHRHGVKLRQTYAVMSHPALRNTEAGAVVRELLLNEMTARTVKAIVRADIQFTPSRPTDRGTTAVGHAFIVDIVNRAIFAMLVRKEFWATQFLPILRAKYGCPDEFEFRQELVAKRTVVTFLRMHLGAIFEGGKFIKLAPVLRGHTAPVPTARLTRFMNGQKAEVHDEIMTTCKTVSLAQQDPSLKLCLLVTDLVAAASTKSPNILKLSGHISTLLEEIGDEAVSTVIRGVAMEALFEIPDPSAFFAALSKYRDGCLLPIGTDNPLDHFFIGQRYRLCAQLLLAADKQQKADAGSLFTNAARYFMVTPAIHEPLLPDPLFALFLDVIKYNLVFDGAEPYDAYPLAQRTFAILVRALPCDLERRREKLTDAMRMVLARMMNLPADFPAEGRQALFEMAEATFALHKVQYPSETDTRRHVMLLVTCSHALSAKNAKITKGPEKEELRAFREVAGKVEEALASDQKQMLRADWAVPKYGAVAGMLQRFTQWGLSKELLDLVHSFSATATFRSPAAARKTQQQASSSPSSKKKTSMMMMTKEDFEAQLTAKYGSEGAKSIEGLKVPTEALINALRAVFRLQQWHRENARRREELEAQREAERERSAQQSQARAERVSSRLTAREITTAANALADLDAKRMSTPQIPPPLPYHAPRFAGGAGLCALISVAKPKSCLTLCAVLAQSETMPPIRWAAQPAGPGARALTVAPSTETTALWFNERWLAEADWFVGDEHPSVVAKRQRVASIREKKKAEASMRQQDTSLLAAMGDPSAAADGEDDDGHRDESAPAATDTTNDTTNARPTVSFEINDVAVTATIEDQPLRSKTLLFAKVFACLIYSQNKYSFLRWTIAGHGWAAPVAELLATMVPNESVHSLVTFGGLPALGDFSEELPRVPHAHIFNRRDATVFLPMHRWFVDRPVLFDRLMARLQGAGVVFPTADFVSPPSFETLAKLSHYAHLGDHLHLLWTSEDQAGAVGAHGDDAHGAESGAEDHHAATDADRDNNASTNKTDGDAGDEDGNELTPKEEEPSSETKEEQPQPDTKDDAVAAATAPAADASDGDDDAGGPRAIQLPDLGIDGNDNGGEHHPASFSSSSSRPSVLYYLVNVSSDPIRFIDLRLLLPSVSMTVYHTTLINVAATTRAIEWSRANRDAARSPDTDWNVHGFTKQPSLPRMPSLTRVCKFIDPHGNAKPALTRRMQENEVELPPTVEPLVATIEQLLLAYPRLGVAIVARHTYIPDGYGGFPNFDFAVRLEHAGASGESDLAAALDGVKSAAWNGPLVASQLMELSACGLLADEAKHAQPTLSGAPSKSVRRTASRVQASIASTTNTLYPQLLEGFVEQHNLALTIPLRSKPQEEEPEPEEVVEEAAPAPADDDRLPPQGEEQPKPGGDLAADEESNPAASPEKEAEDDKKKKGPAQPRDTVEAALRRPDGYHLGWCVAVAAVTRSVGKTTVMQSLVNADVKVRGIKKVPLTADLSETAATSQPADVPFVRLTWEQQQKNQPQRDNTAGEQAAATTAKSSPAALTSTNNHKRDAGTDDDDLDDLDDDEDDRASTVLSGGASQVSLKALPKGHVVQLHFQEVRFDGKRASQMLMQCAAQCVWVVCDKYSLEALQRSGALDRNAGILNVICYNPKSGKAEHDVLEAAKRFALSRSLPFAVVEDGKAAATLLQALIYWMLPSVRFPLAPTSLPPNVELGALCSLDSKVIADYLASLQQASAAASSKGRTLRAATQKQQPKS